MVIHMLKPIKYAIPRVNPKVNYGFGVIMVSDAGNEEDCACVRVAFHLEG